LWPNKHVEGGKDEWEKDGAPPRRLKQGLFVVFPPVFKEDKSDLINAQVVKVQPIMRSGSSNRPNPVMVSYRGP